MLSWALVFLIVALIAAVFGFSGIAGTATSIAWILFVVFLIVALISFLSGRTRTLTLYSGQLRPHRAQLPGTPGSLQWICLLQALVLRP